MWHVAQGVFEWHQRGYLHRDIKPDNVRVDAKGNVVIIDANVAKAIDKCKRGKVMWKRKAAGTPAFMDPLVRDGVYDWSPSAELWSLGFMLESVRRQVGDANTPHRRHSLRVALVVLVHTCRVLALASCWISQRTLRGGKTCVAWHTK